MNLKDQEQLSERALLDHLLEEQEMLNDEENSLPDPTLRLQGFDVQSNVIKLVRAKSRQLPATQTEITEPT